MKDDRQVADTVIQAADLLEYEIKETGRLNVMIHKQTAHCAALKAWEEAEEARNKKIALFLTSDFFLSFVPRRFEDVLLFFQQFLSRPTGLLDQSTSWTRLDSTHLRTFTWCAVIKVADYFANAKVYIHKIEFENRL